MCSGLFTPCHWGEIQRLRKCQVILNRIVSPIYREFLTKISRPGVRSGRCWRISNTQTDVTLWCHVTFWPRHSNAIVEGKIAQLCVLVILRIFIVGNSNFEIVYFKRYIFILCGKNVRFIGNLKCQLSEKSFCPKNDIIFVAGGAAVPFAAPHSSYASGNLAAFTRKLFESGACISKVPKCFLLHTESHSKIWNLVYSEMFYRHTLLIWTDVHMCILLCF